jgi:hypothetical protein
VAVDAALVAFNSSRPILRFRVVFDELGTQILHARGVASTRLGPNPGGRRLLLLVAAAQSIKAATDGCIVRADLAEIGQPVAFVRPSLG